MHIHLDPVGGAAGDMFAAALLDAFPQWAEPLLADFAAAGLTRIATIAHSPHGDGILQGSRFVVEPGQESTGHAHPQPPGHTHGHGHGHAHSHTHTHDDHNQGRGHASPNPANQGHSHRHIKDILALIEGSGLAAGVRARARDIFEHLALAESRVHGMPLEEVSFHEVGAWDSIADVMSAAWLIEQAGPATWSCGTLPLGRGRTGPTEHGVLPVPPPATAALLEGFPMAHLDEVMGERITPTGAAIIKHLNPDFSGVGQGGILRCSGIGFGTKRFPGISNILRVMVFDQPTDHASHPRAQIAECRFEVDDQTPEDLAVGLRNLRQMDGVLDVGQSAMFGKKGRVCAQIQVLTRPEQVDAIVAACLLETTTLGVRWHLVQRATIARASERVDIDGQPIRVKTAQRPDGAVTAKAEMDDIAANAGSEADRGMLRRRAETQIRSNE